MIHISGASSYSNGIEFASNTYCVNFEAYDNSSKIFLRKNKLETSSKALNLAFRIPLLRGAMVLLITSKSLFILLLLGMIPNIFMQKSEANAKISVFTLIISVILSFVILLFIAKFFKLRRQYHGAEHKVAYTNNQGKALTLENCKKAPCTNSRCGTMYIILTVFAWVILVIVTSFSNFTIWPSIQFILAFIISYELFLMNANTPILCWLFKLGYLLQKKVFVLEPNDIQLKQAIEAFQLLERAETGGIPEEELQELLQNGKNLNF